MKRMQNNPNWRKGAIKSRPKNAKMVTSQEHTSMIARSLNKQRIGSETSPDDQATANQTGTRDVSAQGNAQIQINNPIQIYHVYFTQQSQRASLDLKKKLMPFERQYMKEQKKMLNSSKRYA